MKRLKIFIFLSIIIGSCNQPQDELFDNKVVEYYGSKKVKSIRKWNNQNSDENLVTFSEKGDTLEYLKIRGDIKCKVFFNNDTLNYKFYYLAGDNRYWLNEWLVLLKNSKPVLDKSEYLYCKQVNDSIMFKVLTSNLKAFKIVRFEKIDTLFLNGDTLSNSENVITIHNDYLKNSKIEVLIIKQFIKNNHIATTERTIYINFPLKLEFQNTMKINPQMDF